MELEQLKNEMDERGQAISDGKPIQLAKRAITQLTKENQELDVRIAVIEHEITQKVLKMATAHWKPILLDSLISETFSIFCNNYFVINLIFIN